MKIGIIGGGMMGLVTAYYLSRAGLLITVHEKENEIGGLCRSQEIMPGLRWDRFYHVILTQDTDLLNFLDEIGFSDHVLFKETGTGFYADGKLHSISNIIEFFRFEPLSLWDKLRLGTGIFYASKINNSSYLQNISARTWLLKVFGRDVLEKIWGPLLRSKLGSAEDQVSGSFIWATINRYYGTRHKGSRKELMGCTKGGYDTILKQLQNNLLESGVKILINNGVVSVETRKNGRVRVSCSDGKSFEYDRVIATVSNRQLIRLLPNTPDDFRNRLNAINYLSLVCVTLVLKKSLSPFYIINLIEPNLPFTGVIEATHVIPHEILGKHALVYLPKYLLSDDPLFQKSDEEILETFFTSLREIFPTLTDDDIEASTVNKEVSIQPIQDVGYGDKIPSMKTPLENFYIVNTSMIVNSTWNNNQVIQLARGMSDLLLREIE